MKKLSVTGRRVAKRSFAAFMAALFCATGFGTGFFGLGQKNAAKITGSFDVFAASPDANYVAGETYYDAGQIVMNAYYDSTTGNKLSESTANYHATNWDIVNGNGNDNTMSFVANDASNHGVSIFSTTDILDNGKHGSASDVTDGGNGEDGIMCFSEYLNLLNNKGSKTNGIMNKYVTGDSNYKDTDKAVVDYEAPAAVDTKTYFYIAEGVTHTEKVGADNYYQIDWTIFAWPKDQSLNGKTPDEIKAMLDSKTKVESQWKNLGITSNHTYNDGISSKAVLKIPGTLAPVSYTLDNGSAPGKQASIYTLSENKDKSASNYSLFFNGSPEWKSGNDGPFDTWDQWSGTTKDDGTKDHYLMNLGLWSRIETDPVKIEKNSAGKLQRTGTPGVHLDLFAPHNRGQLRNEGDISIQLTEANDTDYLPLWTYTGTGNANALGSVTLESYLNNQSGANIDTVQIPSYNIRKQLYDLWETEQHSFLKKASSLSLWSAKDYAKKTTAADQETYNKNGSTLPSLHVTGVRLYGINSNVRVNIGYVKDAANAKSLADGTKWKETDLTGITAYTGSDFDGYYRSYYAANKGSIPAYDADGSFRFVLNPRDVNKLLNIGSINDEAANAFNSSYIFNKYSLAKPTDDNMLARTSDSTVVNGADRKANNVTVPFLIRSDAYYDITEDYQRAAGTVHGRIPAETCTTNAINTVYNGKTANPTANDQIVDTVRYSGLVSGETYTVVGDVCLKDNNNFGQKLATASKVFTANKSGTVENTFDFNSTTLPTTKDSQLVVVERIYKSDQKGVTDFTKLTPVMVHEDINDAAQTITYVNNPLINTKAALSDDKKTITDVISYFSLKQGESYTVTTTAFDLTTGEFLKDANNQKLEKKAVFTAGENGQGTTAVTFSDFNITSEGQHVIVIFESLALTSKPDVVVVKHEDKNDELQTVKIGADSNVTTTATSSTGSKYLDPIDSEIIKDNVTVTDLKPGLKYTARATLYDVATGEMVTNSENKILTWTEDFKTDTAGKGSFTVTITNFSASNKAGHSLVVHEEILDRNGAVIAKHVDDADANQTVKVNMPGIKTVLGNSDGTKNVKSAATMTLVDNITYSELVPGNNYYMVSTLVDKKTGEILKDSKGNPAVVKSTIFTANSTGSNTGSATFAFANMASVMSGKTVVAYNDLYRVLDDSVQGKAVTNSTKTELLASEKDLENKDQTVVVDAPAILNDATIDTVAKGVDGGKEIPLATNSVIKDTVSYKNLQPGKTYTLTADVYDTSTQQRAIGYTKLVTQDFAASDKGEGDAIMTIDVNTTELAGHKLVVYEVLKLGEKTVAEHRDLTDADQTVTVNNTYQASIDTVATDKASGGKTLPATSEATILDTVKYDGLDTKQPYTLVTTVYNKTTGKKVDSIKDVTTSFTPEAASGSIDVSIPVDGTKFTGGESLVVYEELKTTSKTNSSSNSSSGNSSSTENKTVVVAFHKDISDADQTMTFAKMSTYLTGDGTSSKTVHVGANGYAIDTASFTGLTPGKTYVVTTQLLDVANNAGAVTLASNDSSSDNKASGSAVASRVMEFTPTTANGSIATQINVNTTGLSGHSLVAVATVADKTSGAVIATHNDTSNADQTIAVQTRVEAQTGVTRNAWIFGLIALVMISAVSSYGLGILSDKKHNR